MMLAEEHSSMHSGSAPENLQSRDVSSGSVAQHQNIRNEPEEFCKEECETVEQFWRTYDEVVILSLFSICGVIFRLLAASFFKRFDDVFNENSALFTNLPLNCMSCFLMGLLCSGEDVMKIVHARFGGIVSFVDGSDDALLTGNSSDKLVINHGLDGAGDHENGVTPVVNGSEESKAGLHLRRWKRRRNQMLNKTNEIHATTWWVDRQRQEEEMREVQLLALERRIRASPCLFLFPARKENVDVVEHYVDHVTDMDEEKASCINTSQSTTVERLKLSSKFALKQEYEPKAIISDQDLNSSTDTSSAQSISDSQSSNSSFSNDQMNNEQETNVTVDKQIELFSEIPEATNEIKRKAHINISDGWTVGTTAESMKDRIILGLRVGFCGAVSTFSSWNSDMINLLKKGSIDAAFVGYLIGLQLPIVSFRFGQHVSVYTFVWRCRQETKRDERRGYGLRVMQSGDEMEVIDRNTKDDGEMSSRAKTKLTRKTRSLRAISTLIIITIIVCLLSSIFFFGENLDVQRFSISLLSTPFGVLARWKLNVKLNTLFPSFPLGTFICNIFAVALSGSLGSLLAGNPGPEESIFLTSIIAGFVGSLSTLSTFLIEVLDRIDPILLKFDGMQYAFVTFFWAIVVGLLGSQAKNWADEL